MGSELSLNYLVRGEIPGLTEYFGGCLAEAATVCLEERNHQRGVVLTAYGDLTGLFPLIWEPLTDRADRCYRDEEEATEHGAYGIAVLLILAVTDLTIVERSVKGTGFDFWLGKPDDGPLFQKKARLEVSGIRSSDEAGVRRRLSRKVEQTKRSDTTSLTAYIIVVEFGTPQARTVRR